MLGVLIVTHYRLAEEFLQAVQLIVGELPRFRAIGLDPATAPEDMRRRIEAELKQIDGREGVLMLVDMFGGTPSNLCLSFLDEGRVEVVTGLNLPMLVKVARVDDASSLAEVAQLARDSGRRNISIASAVLNGNERSEDTS
jgi:PTS system mannose-specific IIA component